MGSFVSKRITSLVEYYAFPRINPTYDENHENFFYLPSSLKVPVMFYRQPSKFIIIYAHGNCCDIGDTHYFLKLLSIELSVNIISFDYVGYGLSKGIPSEKGCTDSIDQVYSYVLSQGFLPNNIILYGVSIGTGPTVHLASKQNGLKGLLLQSPYTSAIATQFPIIANSFEMTCSKTGNPDIFLNRSKFKMISCPIIIIHGTDDEIISISHAEQLSLENEKVKLIKLHGYHHNDINDNDIYKYLQDLLN